ncbi:MAG: hypothetical protein V7709_08910 [Halioglobus sp.]
MRLRKIYLQCARSLGLLMTCCQLALSAPPGIAETADATKYDSEIPRKTSLVVPPEMMEGALWKLGNEAVPFEGLFQFEVDTQWGTFPVYGEAMLRLRLRELRAIAELHDISTMGAGLEGAGKSLKKSFERLGHAFIHPKQTAHDIPIGTSRLFVKLGRYGKKIQKALGDSDKSGDREGDKDDKTDKTSNTSSSAEAAAVWVARKYGGVSSKTRKRARDVGVDPYTSNVLLADQLERVSRAEAVGSVSTKLLMPVMAGAIGLMAGAANIAYIQNWREIFTYNAQVMRDMGVSEELIRDFEAHEFYTPMTQTLLIAMLDSIEDAQDRWIAIEQATLLENESEALFFLESIMLAEWYHREQAAIKAFVPNTLIPVATNEHNNLVAFTAADFFYWTKKTEAASRDFTATYASHPGGREFVIADYISPNARRGVEALGWSVRSGLRQTYDVEVPWGAQDHE